MNDATPMTRRTWLGSGRAYPWFVVGSSGSADSSIMPTAKRSPPSSHCSRASSSSITNNWVARLGVHVRLRAHIAVLWLHGGPSVPPSADRTGPGVLELDLRGHRPLEEFLQLVLFRGAEGLGEAFYFPASMSVLADYHGPRTRSRAMSIHQTSVYLGTAGGAILAGYLGEHYGWRSPFWALGMAGLAYALFLGTVLREPVRDRAKGDPVAKRPAHGDLDDWDSIPADNDTVLEKIVRIVTNPAAALLLAVFVGANFVAATFLIWLPSYIFETFKVGLANSSTISTIWSLASLVGALCGGMRPTGRLGGRRAGES